MNGQFYNNEQVRGIIAAYCNEHGINEADFAKLIGAHPTHLSRIKAGIMCSPQLLQKIAALGGVQVCQLIRDEIPVSIRRELTRLRSKSSLPATV